MKELSCPIQVGEVLKVGGKLCLAGGLDPNLQLLCISGIYFQMGDRVGPVGTVETESLVQGSGLTRHQSINQTMNQDRQDALVWFGPIL